MRQHHFWSPQTKKGEPALHHEPLEGPNDKYVLCGMAPEPWAASQSCPCTSRRRIEVHLPPRCSVRSATFLKFTHPYLQFSRIMSWPLLLIANLNLDITIKRMTWHTQAISKRKQYTVCVWTWVRRLNLQSFGAPLSAACTMCLFYRETSSPSTTVFCEGPSKSLFLSPLM